MDARPGWTLIQSPDGRASVLAAPGLSITVRAVGEAPEADGAEAGAPIAPTPGPAARSSPARPGEVWNPLLALWGCDYRVPVRLLPAEGAADPADLPGCGCLALCLAGLSRREDRMVSSECGACLGPVTAPESTPPR